MPYLGHATMVKSFGTNLSFGPIFVRCVLRLQAVRSFKGFGGGGPSAGLASPRTLGLGWTECGNDIPATCPETRARAHRRLDVPRPAIPEIFMMGSARRVHVHSSSAPSAAWNG